VLLQQENYLADSSMYLDDTWKHQPDYSSDSNPSMSPLHDYVPQSSPNLTSMTTFMPGSDYRMMGTSSTFNTPQLQSGSLNNLYTTRYISFPHFSF